MVSAIVCALAAGMVNTSRADSVGIPELPIAAYDYVGYVNNTPAHFDSSFISVVDRDNTPADNPVTNAGATLGRVLFYDKRLSHGNSLSCASCHHQETGFTDVTRFSENSDGSLSTRHSMALANGKYYENGRFLRDESAATLEEQVLMPIESEEMGENMANLLTELSETSFYPGLFQQAFGTPEVSSDRVAKSLSQFVRSMVSYESKFDSAFNENGTTNFSEVLTPAEDLGRHIFHSTGRCAFCHQSEAQVTDQAFNNGLDAFTNDPGAGDGRFKVASLRNAEVRGHFMHDGRFTSLEEVVDFYNTGIQPHPDLDLLLVDTATGQPVQFNFTQEEKDGLVAFLKTLTDWNFLSNPMFSDPFVLMCDMDRDENCDVADLNLLLAEGPVSLGVPVDSENVSFDLNGDGTIDSQDVDVWLSDAAASNGLGSPYLYGDANLDGVVDISDLNRWSGNQFSESLEWSRGDFNGDGLVDVTDLNMWNSNKFAASDGAEPHSLPEPASVALLLSALVGGWLLRRR